MERYMTAIQNKYETIKDFVTKHNIFVSEDSLRWAVFKNINGFADKCIKRVGPKRLLVDVDAVYQWVIDGDKQTREEEKKTKTWSR